MADIAANKKTTALLDGTSDAGSFSGDLEFSGDHDWVKVFLIGGTTYHFYLSFLDTGSLASGNSTLDIRDKDGVSLGVFTDDGGVGGNSALNLPIATSGIYYVDVGEFANNNTGSYSLFVTSLVAIVDPLTDGNDELDVAFLQQRVLGGKGADRIELGSDPSEALGEQGNDILLGGSAAEHLSGGLGNDHIEGGAEFDLLFGDSGNDDLFGGSEVDTLYGGIGNDNLNGDAGSDSLLGGAGKDYLTGGTEADFFVFNSLAEAGKGASRDVITDFSSAAGDIIFLPFIDANTHKASDQAFKFIGTHGFHHKSGELHYLHKGGFLLVEGDVNGDGRADFQIEVHGAATLHASDFNL